MNCTMSTVRESYQGQKVYGGQFLPVLKAADGGVMDPGDPLQLAVGLALTPGASAEALPLLLIPHHRLITQTHD